MNVTGWLSFAYRRVKRGWSGEGYAYQPPVRPITFDQGVAMLGERGHKIVPYGVPAHFPEAVAGVLEGLAREGVPVEGLEVDLARFEAFRAQAGYTKRYPRYYGSRMVEKQLEHFLAAELLGLERDDVFVDVASENSPVPEIYRRMFGANAYWQDIQYKPGLSGRRIGGDACAMPVPDGFATAVTLTCSIEHFERDADQRLCDELVRVIRPGGRLVIAPLYLFTEPAAMTDPVYSGRGEVPFDEGVTLYCAEGWRNRHGRFYSPATLRERVLDRLSGHFDVVVKHVTNPPEDAYIRFVLVARRRPAG